MKSIIIVLMCIFIGNSVFAQQQDGIYLTYNDYVNNKAIPGLLTDIITVSGGKNLGGNLHFKTPDGSTVKYSFHDIWGFTWRGFIFRTVTAGYYDNSTAAVVNKGKLVYYRDGQQLFNHLRFGRPMLSSGTAGRNSDCFISLDLQSPLIAMPYYKSRGNAKHANHPDHDWYEFIDNHPEHQVFTDCILEYKGLAHATECIESYNGKKNLVEEFVK